MNHTTGYSVRAAHCHHSASDDEIYNTICRIVESLERSLEKIRKAQKIVIKTNMAWPTDRIRYFEGRRRELVDDSVMRSVLKLLREHSSAQITAVDTFFGQPEDINYIPLLVGLCPMPPHNRPRNYFHHIIRLSYILPDLGLITQPCLNIIDGLVGQSQREWGGDGRICDALIAGDHVIATDACAAWLMGHDPSTDWPTPPFRRDRNALKVASENGFGTVNMDEIDFQTEVKPPLAEFDSAEPDSKERVRSWRKTTCEQALFYRDHSQEMVDKYAGDYIYLQDGEVVWNGTDPRRLGSRRGLSREKPDHALWLKLVDPDDTEKEHFEVYERNLGKLNDTGSNGY